jgi:hypothetical protein
VLLRLVYWRFANGWLQPVTEYKAIEHNLAKIIPQHSSQSIIFVNEMMFNSTGNM